MSSDKDFSKKETGESFQPHTLASLNTHPIFATAAQRPLTKDEVITYLKIKEQVANYAAPKKYGPFDF